MNIFRKIFLSGLFSKQKYPQYFKFIKKLTGKSPEDFDVYLLALKHASLKKSEKDISNTNERLEFLGDAILDAVMADFLYEKYPQKDEGFLTNMRSRIVNRETLNELSYKTGLNAFIIADIQNDNKNAPKAIYGDTLEAFIGAIYIDKGFDFTKKFIIYKLIIPFFDLGELVHYDPNFKSQLLQITQANNWDVNFETQSINDQNGEPDFQCQLFIKGQYFCVGYGNNKKKAEQDAAQKALEQLK